MWDHHPTIVIIVVYIFSQNDAMMKDSPTMVGKNDQEVIHQRPGMI